MALGDEAQERRQGVAAGEDDHADHGDGAQQRDGDVGLGVAERRHRLQHDEGRADADVLDEQDGDGKPAEPGEVGEVVVTDLNNNCLPFIRYRIGDLAVAMDPERECTCGRGAPRRPPGGPSAARRPAASL